MVPGIQAPGWDLHLVAVGDAQAEPVSRARPVRVVLTEGGRAGRSAGPGRRSGPAARPTTELTLAPNGGVQVRCDAAPPVLLIPAGADPVHTLLGGCDPVTRTVGPGGLLFACTPSVLDALDPAELLAAPRLLRRCPDPASLLRRWVTMVDRRGGPGAAAAIARRQVAPPEPTSGPRGIRLAT